MAVAVERTHDHTASIISEGELDAARAWLASLSKLPINRAVRFRNALQACMRDVQRHQEIDPPLTVMAVDTVEIMAWARYGKNELKAFGFWGLLTETAEDEKDGIRQKRRTELERLDRLILHQLIEARSDPFLLLDPFSEEISSVANALHRAVDQSTSELVHLNHETTAYLQPIQLERLYDYVSKDGRKDGRIDDERWDEVRDVFLPNWREDLFSLIARDGAAFDNLHALTRSERFTFLRGDTAGNRSINRLLERAQSGPRPTRSFFTEFVAFAEREESRTIFVEIKEATIALMAEIDRTHKSSKLIDAAAERDARAIATIHTLNAFCTETERNARFELVSRSPTLHDVLGALPRGRLQVTIRHPFLIPDIYAFDAGSLSAIGNVLSRIDTLLLPYIESVTNHEQGGDSSEDPRDKKLEREIQQICQECFPILNEILPIQQTEENEYFSAVSKEIISQTYGYSLDAEKSRDREEKLADSVRRLFAELSNSLREKNDPFTRMSFIELAQRNKGLAQMQRRHVFGSGKTDTPDAGLEIRVLYTDQPGKASNGELVSTPTTLAGNPIAVRFGGMQFGLVFHIYSERVKQIITDAPRQNASTESVVATPDIRHLDIDSVFDQFEAAFDALRDSDIDRRDLSTDDIVFNLDTNLLACMAFAAKGHFDIAIALATTVLHFVKSWIRSVQEGTLTPNETAGYGYGTLLCLREFYLLRHHCERAVAMDDFFAVSRRFSDAKGTVDKNFARAQRDLDLAAFISEEVERRLEARETDEPSGYRATPAGEGRIRDSRLRLAHLGGWIDQFLVLATQAEQEHPTDIDWQVRERETVRRRLDIWTAAGLVKEITLVAHQAAQDSARADRAGDAPLRRYFAHIELRALQGALMMFLIFLAYPISTDVQRFWIPDRPLSPERVLVFRDWKRWGHRYRGLLETFGFQTRLKDLIDPVLDTLERIDQIGTEARRERRQSPEHADRVDRDASAKARNALSELGGTLQSWNRPARSDGSAWSDDDRTAMTAVGGALEERVKEVIAILGRQIARYEDAQRARHRRRKRRI